MNFSIEPSQSIDYASSITDSLPTVASLLMSLRQKYGALKYYIIFELKFRKILEEEIKVFGFYSSTMTLLLADSINSQLDECQSKIMNAVDKFTRQGSGWIFEEIDDICLHVTKYFPCSGGSTYLPLPPEFHNKRCLLNIQNVDDDYCIMYCLLAALYPHLNNSISPSDYLSFIDKLNFNNIDFPTPINQISKLEKMNGLRINCFGFDKSLNTGIFPCYISNSTLKNVINLLLINDEGGKKHYVLIKDLDTLLRLKTKHRKGMKFCYRCLQGFTTQRGLDDHERDCNKFPVKKIITPNEGEVLKFENYKALLNYEIVIYADFESLLVPVKDTICGRTVILDQHIPFAYAYKVVSSVPELTKPVKYVCAENCIDLFIEDLHKEYKSVEKYFKMVSELVMSDEDNKKFYGSNVCGICDEPLDWKIDNKNKKPVRHHNHFTGKFITACHSDCNIRIQKRQRIAVVFHNLKNYDSKHIIKSLHKLIDNQSEINILASNSEKFIQITTSRFIFCDSYLLLNAKLEKLVNELKETGIENFHFLKYAYPIDDHFYASLGKGLFPYNYLTSYEKLQDPIPTRQHFYNTLDEKLPSEKEYNHLRLQCTLFNLKTIGDLTKYYCSLDVLLLADVVENFRAVCKKDYGLDILAFPTLPSFSFNAMLKKCKVNKSFSCFSF